MLAAHIPVVVIVITITYRPTPSSFSMYPSLCEPSSFLKVKISVQILPQDIQNLMSRVQTSGILP